MSSTETPEPVPAEVDPGGTVYDDPNRQAVGLDPAWVEGEGGEGVGSGTGPGPLDAMTKDDLLTMAQELGVSPANASMNKADLIAGIEAKQAEG
jgi:Rho termination factor, N-terminal domain